MTPFPLANSRNQGGSPSEPWHLKLYIARWTPASVSAFQTIKLLEAEHLPQGSTVEVIDVLEKPEAGVRDNVLAIPTVVRVRPGPVRRIVGSLSDISKTLKILGFARS